MSKYFLNNFLVINFVILEQRELIYIYVAMMKDGRSFDEKNPYPLFLDTKFDRIKLGFGLDPLELCFKCCYRKVFNIAYLLHFIHKISQDLQIALIC